MVVSAPSSEKKEILCDGMRTRESHKRLFSTHRKDLTMAPNRTRLPGACASGR